MNLSTWFAARPLMAEFACVGLCRRSAGRVACRDWASYRPHRTWWDWDPVTRKGSEVDLGPGPRFPPLPFYKGAGLNNCRVCGQPIYAGGDWRPAAGRPRPDAAWHRPCYVAYTTWTSVNYRWRYLATRQGWRCAESGVGFDEPHGYVVGTPEVDHERPLWRLLAEPHRYAWPSVLYWYGVANLRALTVEAHRAKTAREARERAAMRRAAA